MTATKTFTLRAPEGMVFHRLRFADFERVIALAVDPSKDGVHSAYFRRQIAKWIDHYQPRVSLCFVREAGPAIRRL